MKKLALNKEQIALRDSLIAELEKHAKRRPEATKKLLAALRDASRPGALLRASEKAKPVLAFLRDDAALALKTEKADKTSEGKKAEPKSEKPKAAKPTEPKSAPARRRPPIKSGDGA